jgi:hypothetical protein
MLRRATSAFTSRGKFAWVPEDSNLNYNIATRAAVFIGYNSSTFRASRRSAIDTNVNDSNITYIANLRQERAPRSATTPRLRLQGINLGLRLEY